MEDGFKEYLKKEGVSNPENPTKSDIKKYWHFYPLQQLQLRMY